MNDLCRSQVPRPPGIASGEFLVSRDDDFRTPPEIDETGSGTNAQSPRHFRDVSHMTAFAPSIEF